MRNIGHYQGGSALFWILIGVALFAALGLAVTRGMRGGGEEVIAEEAARLRAVAIVQYGNSLRAAVQALRVEGVAPDRLSFETPLLSGYANSACGDDSCRVFGTGGGVAYRAPDSGWLDSAQSAQPLYGQWYFPAQLCAQGVGSGGAGCDSDGADNEDVVAILPWVRREVCAAINEKLGLANPGDPPPVEVGNGWAAGHPKFTGGFADGAVLEQGGRMAGCFAGNGAATPPGGAYAYFQILAPR